MLNTRLGLAPVAPAQMPMGMHMSRMLRNDEVSMCHTARASVRGAKVPVRGGRMGVVQRRET